jgi:hypothetical protein
MDFMRSWSEALDLQRNAVIMLRDEVRLLEMGVDESVVMSNEATARQLYTHGNNEVLLRHFFATQHLLC